MEAAVHQEFLATEIEKRFLNKIEQKMCLNNSLQRQRLEDLSEREPVLLHDPLQVPGELVHVPRELSPDDVGVGVHHPVRVGVERGVHRHGKVVGELLSQVVFFLFKKNK